MVFRLFLEIDETLAANHKPRNFPVATRAQVTYVFHKTGTTGADDWYKNAFKPFLDGGLHSGEVGGPETGAAFKTVFNVVVLRGREAENETVAVAFVHPQASSDAIAKFFDDKNPFWQTGRDE